MSRDEKSSQYWKTGIKSLLAYAPPTAEEFWSEKRERQAALVPEKRLWAAVLKDAIECIRGQALVHCGTPKYRKRYRQIEQRSTRTWFMSTSTDPGTFLWVCAVLEIQPEKVRRFIAGRL